MTRHLITVLFAACLFAATPACGYVQKSQEAKQSDGDAEQKQLEDAILRLRDLLYCDESLDESLDAFAPNDESVGRAVAEVRAKDYARAISTLRGLKGRAGLPYWLALAAAHRGAGDAEEARAAARRLVSSEETRVRLQAWTVLRELGETPPAKQADEVLGVVVEVSLDKGVVIIAGYADGVARHFFSRGGGIIGDNMPESVERAAKELTRTAAPLARTMPAGRRQELPARAHVRVTLLTPSGMRVAEVTDGRAEDPKNPLHEVYMAAFRLNEELQKAYGEHKGDGDRR